MSIVYYNVDALPKKGPYSHAVEVNGFIFVSGVIPIDTKNNSIIYDDIIKATSITLENIKTIVEAAGSSIEKIVKVTVYLKNMEHFSDMNTAYNSFFKNNFPARTCIGVYDLPGGVPIEIDVIAVK